MAGMIRGLVEKKVEGFGGEVVAISGLGETFLEGESALECWGYGVGSDGVAVIISQSEGREREIECGALVQARGSLRGLVKGVEGEKPLALAIVNIGLSHLDFRALESVCCSALSIFDRFNGGGKIAFLEKKIRLKELRVEDDRTGRRTLDKGVERFESAFRIL